MVDHQFADPSLAVLYDLFCPWDPRGDFGFYLPLVMAADSVLDVGCGTGMLLRRARAEGHAGRLCGLDPAAAMLDVARAGQDIEWVLGDLSTARWDEEFEVIVMTGHAFQVLTGDEQLREALAAVRAALAPGGRFAFETRNPLARQWETWVPANAVQVIDAAGAVVQMAHQVELPVQTGAVQTGAVQTGAVQTDLVSFTTTYSSPDWERSQRSRSTLRFLDAEALSSFLAGAGLEIEEQYGDWDRSPLCPASPEIITICR
ncbi:MAG TPA: class I SAM-dependent methyltransferase [Streptosporangiaceae bacterium]